MINIEQLVMLARQQKCSDIHLTVGLPCTFRRHGELVDAGLNLSAEDTGRLIIALMGERKKDALDAGRDLDFSFSTSGGERQRVNVFREQGRLAASIRLLNNFIPTLEQLHLPTVLRDLADLPRGLILVTGPTGSGKSTTLAAMIDYVNKTRPVHILTIEDPIEYIYTPARALIHQREVGRDTESFATALRSSLREDPDVILVGEMRDFETISAAVTAAETGHLVLSTLHTTGAPQTIDRIVDSCPPQSQQQMRVQLSTILKGIITQTLAPLADGSGRIAATEILLGTDAVLSMVRESKTHQLTSSMQSGAALGMHTLDADLASLVRRGLITKAEAYARAVSRSELEDYL